MKEAGERKVSSVVALSVTLLAVVTALAFSFATMTYQSEVVALKKINADYKKTIDGYKAVLEDIKKQISKVEVK
jgi:hypothetical protein